LFGEHERPSAHELSIADERHCRDLARANQWRIIRASPLRGEQRGNA
jgi:hypothetical protein